MGNNYQSFSQVRALKVSLRSAPSNFSHVSAFKISITSVPSKISLRSAPFKVSLTSAPSKFISGTSLQNVYQVRVL